MSNIDRRQWIAGTGAAAALVASRARAVAPSEQVVIGVIGCGGRGTHLARVFAGQDDARVAYACDPDTPRAEARGNLILERQGKAPRVVKDFREALEDQTFSQLEAIRQELGDAGGP